MLPMFLILFIRVQIEHSLWEHGGSSDFDVAFKAASILHLFLFFSLFHFCHLFMRFSVGNMIKLKSLSQIFVSSSSDFIAAYTFYQIFTGSILFMPLFMPYPGCILC